MNRRDPKRAGRTAENGAGRLELAFRHAFGTIYGKLMSIIPEKKTPKKAEKARNSAIILPMLVAFAVSLVLTVATVQPKRYDLKVDDVSDATIKATRDIVDEVTTKQLTDEAVSKVDVRYTENESVTREVSEGMDAFEKACGNVRVSASEEKERWRQQEVNRIVALALEADPNSAIDPATITVDMSGFAYSESFLDELAGMLPGEVNGDDVRVLLDMSGDDLDIVCRILKACVDNIMTSGVKESLLQATYSTVMEDFTLSLPDTDPSMVNIADQAVRTVVRANLILDSEAYESACEAAKETVTPVMYKEGEIVVQEGTRVTQAQYSVLASLNLLTSNSVDWMLYLSVALAVAGAIAVFSIYICLFQRQFLTDSKKLWMLGFVISLNVLFAYVCHFFDIRMSPVPLIGIITAAALKERTGLAISLLASFLASLLAGTGGQIFTGSSAGFMIAAFSASAVGVYFIRGRQMQRGTLLWAGLVAGVVGAGFLMVASLANSDGVGLWNAGALGLVSGVLSGMLSLGIMPVCESVFGLLTPMKLLELSNPNHPLLRRLQMEAPGTYHHSIVVANIAEQGVEAIGGDGLFTRVAAYYHDVGKIKRPMFFKENQLTGENPHDNIAPELSAMILISHTTDGIKFAKKYNVPKEIQDVILQHHGNTLTAFFYSKALKIAEEQENGSVHEPEFRYPGPRPRTKEAAVIMLADTVEAASRTMREHSPEAIRELVDKLIRGKLKDGQLDEAPITMGDVYALVDSFTKALSGTYHERIEYPELPQRESAALPKSTEQ